MSALFANNPDVGNLQQQNFIEIGMAGTLKDFVFKGFVFKDFVFKDFVFKDYRGNTGTAGGVSGHVAWRKNKQSIAVYLSFGSNSETELARQAVHM